MSIASNMWNSESSDRVFWSDAAKMLLVGLIKKYPDSIRDVRGSRKDFDKEKHDAWDLIFKDLLDYGMPSTTLDRVKCIWSKMKSQALDAHKPWKLNQKADPMTKVQKAVIDVIELMNKESQHLMPMPVKIKTEPMDEDDTNDVQNIRPLRNLRARKSTSAKPNKNTQNETEDEHNSTASVTASVQTNNNTIVPPSEAANANTDLAIKGNLNPVVVLNRIPMKHPFGDRMVNGDDRMVNGESAKYWNLMTEHEKERMAFERELHRKNLELMDLKLRIEKEKLDAMVPRLFE